MLKIRKRSGEEVLFDRSKIERAIEKANASVSIPERLDRDIIAGIALSIENACSNMKTIPTVESVQDMVEYAIAKAGAYRLAKNYAVYRYQHELMRKANTTDDKILAILHRSSADAKEENSNKNPDIVSTQRDYIAGEVNRDLTRRLILPAEITAAHDEGRIHFHDTDYSAQPIHNCDLVNLEDMLQNGTVITGTLIEKPHSFSTACNIATQIIAQVASSQYGGQTITLTHLAPFVEVSRQKFRTAVREELTLAGIQASEDQINLIAEERVKEDVKKGVQIIQYQVVTLMTTNGQAPFISVCMCLNECGDDEGLRNDLAMVIAEMLRQRIQGVKNEVGVWVAPAFPKLLYFLEEDNTYEGSKYFWLTKLAAKCSAKHLTGHSHTDKEGKPLALAIMQKMNDKCAEWKKTENIDYSLYGTPLESTTYKFAKALKAKFGVVPEVSDHDYITNSYHVNVREPIDAFAKLSFESEFQALSPGGAVSYVEVPNMTQNIPAVISVIQFIYENIMYAELNTKSDYCQVCGYDGEIQIVEDGGKLVWECPNCGNRDQHKMNVARRTCGYIGTQFWNQGRTQEIRERVLHL